MRRADTTSAISESPNEIYGANPAQASRERRSLEVDERVNVVDVEGVLRIKHGDGLRVDESTCQREREQVCRFGGMIAVRSMIVCGHAAARYLYDLDVPAIMEGCHTLRIKRSHTFDGD